MSDKDDRYFFDSKSFFFTATISVVGGIWIAIRNPAHIWVTILLVILAVVLVPLGIARRRGRPAP